MATENSNKKESDTGGVSARRDGAGSPKIPEADYSSDSQALYDKRFANLGRLITRDLNKPETSRTGYRYTKEQIYTYLDNPARHEKELRSAVVYLYGVSPHFRRLIQYFVGLSDLSYYVSPYKIDPKRANKNTVGRNYRRVLDLMSSMNIETQLAKVLTVVLREDVFYGTLWTGSDTVTIQQLPSDYCAISSIEGNVLNVTFNFSFFDTRPALLETYPPEFKKKYTSQYKSKRGGVKWIELDSPTSFAIKCNTDILDYAMPPFSGILREIYDLEDYRQLKLEKTALENYAMVSMELPTDDKGGWGLEYEMAREFWRNLDGVLPDEIGSILTPMKLEKISFERSGAGDRDTIADAEQSLFTAAGVSSLLFNNEKASSNALLLSIKADQAVTYGIVKSIEDAINRYIQAQSFGKNFSVTFIDSSPFNRKEVGDQYLKAAQYGLPTVMMYASSQGLGQSAFDSMNFLENEVLGLKPLLIPLQSSNTMSSEEGKGATDEGGAPTKDVGEVSDSREGNSERE